MCNFSSIYLLSVILYLFHFQAGSCEVDFQCTFWLFFCVRFFFFASDFLSVCPAWYFHHEATRPVVLYGAAFLPVLSPLRHPYATRTCKSYVDLVSTSSRSFQVSVWKARFFDDHSGGYSDVAAQIVCWFGSGELFCALRIVDRFCPSCRFETFLLEVLISVIFILLLWLWWNRRESFFDASLPSSEPSNCSAGHAFSSLDSLFANLAKVLLFDFSLLFSLKNLHRYYDTKQRWPHFFNSIKYALAQTVIFVGIFHPLYIHTSQHNWNWHRLVILNFFFFFLFSSSSPQIWLSSCILSAFYAFAWDVWADWGIDLSSFSLDESPRRTLVFRDHKWVNKKNVFELHPVVHVIL